MLEKKITTATMKYEEIKGKKFITNGRSKVRVELVSQRKSPMDPTRVLKIFEVHEVIAATPDNPIERGHHIPLSFPQQHANAKSWDWTAEKRSKGGWVETQVPMSISDRAAALRTATKAKLPSLN